jgi:hypothetical protein
MTLVYGLAAIPLIALCRFLYFPVFGLLLLI